MVDDQEKRPIGTEKGDEDQCHDQASASGKYSPERFFDAQLNAVVHGIASSKSHESPVFPHYIPLRRDFIEHLIIKLNELIYSFVRSLVELGGTVNWGTTRRKDR